MGMFNTIYADLHCPITDKVNKETEIQMKWQEIGCRGFSIYHINDFLNNLDNEYNNTWIKTDYICPYCSKYTRDTEGRAYIKTMDQSRHFAFIRVEDSVIKEIVTEKEFLEYNPKATYVEDL